MTYPFDLLRSQLAISKSIYPGAMLRHIQVLFLGHGIKAFYQGLGTSLLQIFPYMGLNFYFYSLFKEEILTDGLMQGLPLPLGLESLVAGAFSGLLSKSLVFPLDVLKRLQQVQIMSSNTIFNRTFSYNPSSSMRPDIFKITKNLLENEGKFSFWKGFTPAILKSVVSSGSSFYFHSIFLYYLSQK